ncbi:PadR family transcriptional regulator [Cohnella nanjingensis]|uniref:PadR family transcriptional regulator n=1 Tax=Cohnella nanjingensis TaxID=1387779 RepID=A0A7X0RV88_9BACL|nr:PadR family transcriptional regulator [Cohnella nanjingensis]MBB6674233.1 PadR family transcriptional regulator [Cohnella nanjingensis]
MNSQDVILGLLHRRPLTGYEIKNSFEMPLSFFFDAGFGTIYPTLAKLESLGFITKESVEQDNRPNKNVYSLTDAGRARFKAYLDSPLERDLYRSDFMVRLFFAHYQDRETLIGWVRQEIATSEWERQMILDSLAEWEPQMTRSQSLCARIGIASMEAKTKALAEGLAALERENP